MFFIGLAGYLLPIPSLIWAWVRWLNSKPRFVPPAWRSIVAFSALILASAIGLSVLLVAFHANSLPEGASKYSFAVASSRFGFAASMLALALALVGKGPVCLPAALASFGLASLLGDSNRDVLSRGPRRKKCSCWRNIAISPFDRRESDFNIHSETAVLIGNASVVWTIGTLVCWSGQIRTTNREHCHLQ